MNKMMLEVNDIYIKENQTYKMFSYVCDEYSHPSFDKKYLINKGRVIVRFNKPIDLHVGCRYILSDLEFNPKFNNYLYSDKSRHMEIMRNDLMNYM